MAPRALIIFGDDDRGLRRLLLTAMTLGFVALLAAGVAAWWSTDRNQRFGALVEHTYRVREAIGDFQVAIERSETARRGYLLTGQQQFADLYSASSGRLRPSLATIDALVADNPRQRRVLGDIARDLAEIQPGRDRSVTDRTEAARTRAIVTFDSDGAVLGIRAIRAQAQAMNAEETRLLRQRVFEQRASAGVYLSILLGAGILVLIVAITTLVTVLRYTRDLGASREGLRTLNDTLENQVVERTADLSRANEEIQRFAYIVSHDLRSPLVNVMGFTAELEAGAKAIAELVDRAEEAAPGIVTDEARNAAREDLPEAIGFIRTSTAKMDRLISAILKLSREGRRVITPEPLEMTSIMAGIRDTLQHRLDEKGAEIVVEPPLPTLTTDRLAIEQVFANIIENAVKYLDPRRPGRIVVSARVEASRAIFEIADNGRGIDPRDHARVFDLFRRSGVQDQPGEGIGLAHVRALTYRLGGTIDVASTLGEGATFRINLPVNYVEPSGPPE